jgi:two-component system, NtrC family, sensor histidine kinase PilS
MTEPPPGVSAPAAGDSGSAPFVDRRLWLVNSPALLRWLLAGRVLLAVSVLAQASLARSETPGAAPVAVIVVVLALAVTVTGAYLGLVRRERPPLGLIQGQAVMDLLLVTALVHFAGAFQTGWVALYVLVIAMYGLILPVRTGALVAAFGAVALLGDAYFLQPRGADAPGLWGQVAVFITVFALVAWLGQRLRAAAVEQTQLETELERVRLEADEILRTIRSGVITVDGRGQLAFANPTAEQLLGLEPGHVGRPVLDLLAERAPELHRAVEAGIGQGRRVERAEGTVQRPGGRAFPIGLSTATFERESEPLPAVTAIFTDISDLQYLEDLHLRTERLEAVAALGASLAHEIRNPLASIRSAVEQLARAHRDDRDERVLGDLILRESDRLSRLLGEFLDFSRVRPTHVRVVNLLGVAQDAVRLVREHPDCGAGVAIAVSGAPVTVQGDEDLLHRVVWNLVLNAAQALRARGRGRVDVSLDVPPEDDLPRGTALEPVVRLRVRDDGPGIEPDLLERLFQPFVSGRPGGSGLGLAIVQRAVEAHRGLVLVDSAPGAGTTFTILLHARGPMEDTA